jgi:hypothetical protein
MNTDTSYSFFSSPDFEQLGNIPRSEQVDMSQTGRNASFVSTASSTASVDSVDSSYGFFSSPSLKETIVQIEHKPEKRVQKVPSAELVCHNDYTLFGI